MSDPRKNLSVQEFSSASTYFYQHPATLQEAPGGGSGLTADRYTLSDEPNAVNKAASTIASKRKSGWGDMRQSHSMTPNDRFMTTNKQSFQTEGERADMTGLKFDERIPRMYHTFTKHYDNVKLSRSTPTLR